MSVEVFEFFFTKMYKKRIWSEYEHVQESTLDFLGFPERINKYFEMAILQEKLLVKYDKNTVRECFWKYKWLNLSTTFVWNIFLSDS